MSLVIPSSDITFHSNSFTYPNYTSYFLLATALPSALFLFYQKCYPSPPQPSPQKRPGQVSINPLHESLAPRKESYFWLSISQRPFFKRSLGTHTIFHCIFQKSLALKKAPLNCLESGLLTSLLLSQSQGSTAKSPWLKKGKT